MYARDAATERFHIIDSAATDMEDRVVTRQGYLTAHEAENAGRALYLSDTFIVAFKARSGGWRVKGEDGWPSA